MKKSIYLSVLATIFVALASFTTATKLVSTKVHVQFFSTTPAEDIESHNYKAVSTIDPESGEVVFSVPMQSFEFEKALMQKHFNNKNFLETKKFPKAKMTGKIINPGEVDFEKDGTYTAKVQGELTIKGETNPMESSATVTVKGKSVEVESTFPVTLADYGISFSKGKPSTNIAYTVEVTINAFYKAQ